MGFWAWWEGRGERRRLTDDNERLQAEKKNLEDNCRHHERRADDLEQQARALEHGAANWQRLCDQYLHEKKLLIAMLEDRGNAMTDAATLRQVNVVLERHNASAQASNEWAIAHINLLTLERNALLADRTGAELAGRPGAVVLPNAEYQYTAPSDTHTPPPGPIGASPSIAGVPIPEGRTAGDVIAALRARRDREAEQVPTDPADLLKQAADIFEEPAGVPGASDNEPPPTDPFADIP